jgi:rsbT antagonist protein RsbS
MGRAIPIIKLYDTLIVSVQIELSDTVLRDLRDDLSAEISRRNVSGLVIEASGIDVVDSFIARAVRDVAKLASLMGVRTVLAGLDASMAITLVEMGMHMDGVDTAMNLEAALQTLGFHLHKDAETGAEP